MFSDLNVLVSCIITKMKALRKKIAVMKIIFSFTSMINSAQIVITIKAKKIEINSAQIVITIKAKKTEIIKFHDSKKSIIDNLKQITIKHSFWYWTKHRIDSIFVWATSQSFTIFESTFCFVWSKIWLWKLSQDVKHFVYLCDWIYEVSKWSKVETFAKSQEMKKKTKERIIYLFFLAQSFARHQVVLRSIKEILSIHLTFILIILFK